MRFFALRRELVCGKQRGTIVALLLVLGFHLALAPRLVRQAEFRPDLGLQTT
jgi:hypothetical protein